MSINKAGKNDYRIKREKVNIEKMSTTSMTTAIKGNEFQN